MLRILIADDEQPARQRLRQLLTGRSGIEVVGEAESGAQVMELTAEAHPDLLLLDIEMPQGTGLDVAASLPSPRPAIIFCTAFDQHAVDAFELNAVDYLLKPVSRTRLEKALARVHAAFCASPSPDAIDRFMRKSEPCVSRLLVRNGDRYLVISAVDIAYFESKDGLTRLVTNAGQEYWLDPSIQQLEARLDPRDFCRISRSILVLLSAVAEIYAMPGGGAEVLLKMGTKLDVSRRRVKELFQAIERG